MKKGFTLIELVMVIVILGILAATALPRFVNLQYKAKENAARATLGAIRAAVAITYASNAAYNSTNAGNDYFPNNITGSLFADGMVPQEPYTGSSEVTAGTGKGISATGRGWMYDSLTGRVWINNASYSTY